MLNNLELISNFREHLRTYHNLHFFLNFHKKFNFTLKLYDPQIRDKSNRTCNPQKYRRNQAKTMLEGWISVKSHSYS